MKKNKGFFAEFLKYRNRGNATGKPYIFEWVANLDDENLYSNFKDLVKCIVLLSKKEQQFDLLGLKNVLSRTIKGALKANPEMDIRPHDYLWRNEDQLKKYLEKNPQFVQFLYAHINTINKLGQSYNDWWEKNGRKPGPESKEEFEQRFLTTYGKRYGRTMQVEVAGEESYKNGKYMRRRRFRENVVKINKMPLKELKEYVERMKKSAFDETGNPLKIKTMKKSRGFEYLDKSGQVKSEKPPQKRESECNSSDYQLYVHAKTLLDKIQKIEAFTLPGLQEKKEMLEKNELIKYNDTVEHRMYNLIVDQIALKEEPRNQTNLEKADQSETTREITKSKVWKP